MLQALETPSSPAILAVPLPCNAEAQLYRWSLGKTLPMAP